MLGPRVLKADCDGFQSDTEYFSRASFIKLCSE